MSIHEYIRQHIYKNKGLLPSLPQLSIDELKESEWCGEFENLMRNRLIMGAFRYGLIKDNKKSKHLDRIKYIETKLMRYKTTNNLECLVDMANLSMLEFIDMKDVYEFKSMDNTKEHQGEKRWQLKMGL
ncbi:hypothetical protein KAR91_40680 [Candidatus Pacearchaeota archaeon]|nr:hypothetical protein [Candidatus Pacearchaeota archaeon]